MAAGNFDGSIRINTLIDSDTADDGLKVLEQSLKNFASSASELLKLKPTVDSKAAEAKLSEIKTDLKAIDATDPKIKPVVDIGASEVKLSTLKSDVKILDATDPVITPTVDSAPAESTISKLTSSIKNLIGLAAGAAIGKTLFDSLIGSNADMEQYETSFTVLLGSAEEAKQMLEDLTTFAAKTPLELTDVTQQANQLLNYGVAAEDIIPTLTKLGDLSSGNATKLEAVTRAYGQMTTNGKVSLEDLNQMTEAGVPILQALADTAGVSTSQMREMITAGTVGLPELNAAIDNLTTGTGKFAGMMEKQSGTMNGMWSTLKDNISQFARDVGENAFGKIKEAMQSVLESINEASESGALDKIAGTIGTIIGDIVSAVIDLVGVIKTAIPLIASFFALWEITTLGEFVVNAGGVAAVIIKMNKAIQSGIILKIADKAETLAIVALYVKDAVVKAADTVAQIALNVAVGAWNIICGIATAVTGAFSAALTFLAANPIVLVVAAIAALVVAIILLVKNWNSVKAAAQSAWTSMQNAWSSVAPWFNASVVTPILGFFSSLWKSISSAAGSVVSAIQGAWSSISSWFTSSVIEPIKNAFQPLINWFSTLFQGIWLIIQAVWITVSGWFSDNVITPIVDFFSPIVETIGNFFTTLWGNITSIWSSASKWFNSTVIAPLLDAFSSLIDSVSGFFTDLWSGVTSIWGSISEWFSANVTGPLVDDFNAAIDAISNAFETVFGGIGDFLKSIFNGLISDVESGINAIISAMNALISGFNSVATWAAGVVGSDYGGLPSISNVSLPRLAQGAVIPPNREFMAVLGDQKSGTNIEAPLGTMVEAFKAAAASMNAGSGDTVINNVTKLDGRTIAKNQQRISKLNGTPLVTKGALT